MITVLPSTQVTLYPRGDIRDGSVGFPSNFVVEGSSDGQQWTQLASGAGTAVAGSGARTLTYPSTTVKYIKVSGSGFKPDSHGDYYMQFGEVEVN
ncbi:discoidin domain-containing protein [Kutzneria sp. NPDC051319]|uniref:discoidin domain-containing protein n=1 Tax=Kutzneria sp. NPDC051319 TaxID=3155047 RepID=UPI00342A2CC9